MVFHVISAVRKRIRPKAVFISYTNPTRHSEPGQQVQQLIWGTDSWNPETDNTDDSKPVAPGAGGVEVKLYQPRVAEDVVKQAEKTPEGKKTLPTVPQE